MGHVQWLSLGGLLFFFKGKGELVDLMVRGDGGTREGGRRGKCCQDVIYERIKEKKFHQYPQTVRNIKILIQSHKYSLHHTFKRMPLGS